MTFGEKNRARLARLRSTSLEPFDGRTIAHDKDGGDQDRNQADHGSQRGRAIHLQAVHQSIAQNREPCASEACDDDPGTIEVARDQQHDNHIEAGNGKLERRQRVDDENRNCNCRGKQQNISVAEETTMCVSAFLRAIQCRRFVIRTIASDSCPLSPVFRPSRSGSPLHHAIDQSRKKP